MGIDPEWESANCKVLHTTCTGNVPVSINMRTAKLLKRFELGDERGEFCTVNAFPKSWLRRYGTIV